MPLTIFNFSRAWRAHFLSNYLQTWQSCFFFVDLQLILMLLLDLYDCLKVEKNEKAFLSIFSELLGIADLAFEGQIMIKEAPVSASV